tara:strand:+ start:2177 stop:2452 length:276 start_codon:yes stop_codon:yes gene_type:complete
MQKQSDLYKEIAKKYNISVHVVEHIVRHQFTFLLKNLENPKLPSILLHRLGTFKVKDGRIDALIKGLEKKETIEAEREILKLKQIKNERSK